MLYYDYFNTHSGYDKLPENFDWGAAKVGTIIFAKMIDASGYARPSVMKWVKTSENLWYNLGDSGPVSKRALRSTDLRFVRELLNVSHDWRILDIVEPTLALDTSATETDDEDTENPPLIVEKHMGTVDDDDTCITYEIVPVIVENLTAGRAAFGLHIRVEYSNQNVIYNIVASVLDCTVYVYDIREDISGSSELVQTHIVPIMQISERNELVKESMQKTMYDRICTRLAIIVMPHVSTDTRIVGKITSDSLYALFEHIALDSLWLAGQGDEPGILGIVALTEHEHSEIYLHGVGDIGYNDSKLSNYRRVVVASETPMAFTHKDETKLENYKVSRVVIVSEQNQEVKIIEVKE